MQLNSDIVLWLFILRLAQALCLEPSDDNQDKLHNEL